MATRFSNTVFPGMYPDCYSTDDSTPNLLLALQVVREASITFRPEQVCSMLRWSLVSKDNPSERQSVRLLAADDRLKSKMLDGSLQIEEGYYIVTPAAADGRFANTFGVGAGFTAVVPVAVAEFCLFDLLNNPGLLRQIGKWTAAACVAGSALFLFLTAVEFMRIPWGVLLSLIYALGTCVYAVSSQDLWQHGPTELFLAAGIYFLHRSKENSWLASLAGAALALATWCRPTSAIVFICVGAYLLWRRRGLFGWFLTTGVPLGLLLMLFNTIQFGGPTKFGQTELQMHALEKTGSTEIWQTSLLYGAFASLLSPSRGLLVFSPLLLFSAGGIRRLWRNDRYQFLLPIAVAILCVWCVEFRHFDWWSGWSFGYRHLIDTVVLLAFLMIPLFDHWCHSRLLDDGKRLDPDGVRVPTDRELSMRLFFFLVGISVMIQWIGVFLYDRWGWNSRPGFLVSFPGEVSPRFTVGLSQAKEWAKDGGTLSNVPLNIDDPRFRSRLWSITDSQLVYYATHAAESYYSKQAQLKMAELPRATRLAETYDRLGQAACALGDLGEARSYFVAAYAADPRYLPAYFHAKGLDAALPNTGGDGTSPLADELSLDQHLRDIIDRLARGMADEMTELIQFIRSQRTAEEQDALAWAIERLAIGEMGGERSDLLQPVRDRLNRLSEELTPKLHP